MLLKNLLCLIFSIGTSTAVSFLLNTSSTFFTSLWYMGILILLPFSFGLNLFFGFRSKDENFSQLLLGGIVIKMLVALISIVLYSLIDRPRFFAFSIHFIAQYILFTTFEIRYLLYIIKTRQHAKNK